MKSNILPTIILLAFALGLPAQQPADDVPANVVEADVATPDVVVAPSTAIEQSVADLWIVIGPDNQMLPGGTYRFIRVPPDPNQSVEVTTVVAGDGGPGPPPVGDLASKTAAALAKVTEADKVKTATSLLTVFEETVKSIDSGSLADQTQVATALKLVLTFSTQSKAGWESFVKLAGDTLTASTSMQSTKASLQIFVTELKKL